MSNAMDLLNALNIPKYRYITLSEYQALGSKDSNTLYFIKGTSIVYRGAAPYGSSIKTVTALPAAEDALAELQYFVTDGADAGIYVLNAAKDGFTRTTVSQKYVDDAVAGTINGVSHDAETGDITFTRNNAEPVVFNIPKDNFLSAASFKKTTNILTLELTNGTKVDVSLKDLMNVYSGGETDTAAVAVDEDGEITVNVNVSESAGNALTVKEDGLHVEGLALAGTLDEASTNEQAVGAKLVYDILSALAWQETA